MGVDVVFVTVLLSLVLQVHGKANKAIKINLTEEWEPDLGWKVTCVWETQKNDTLQSLRLSKDGQQFMIYRPENHGLTKHEVFRTPEKVMTVDCDMEKPGWHTGVCTLTVEPLQPPKEAILIDCEVSGERPTFRIDEREIPLVALVPPSDAVIVSKPKEEESNPLVSLNCSSSGLPAPNLIWTVDSNKVEADFTDRFWNATSKLWHVWSTLSYTSQGQKVVCTPEVTIDENTHWGRPAEYNTASRYLCTTALLLTSLLPLLR